MADEQNWPDYADQATLADTDTILARTAAGAGVEVPGSALVKKNAAGHVGLGTVPSAWSAGSAFQIGTWTALADAGAYGSAYTFNAYYDGVWKYKTTNAASRYEQDGGHRWYVGSSGAANAAISFAEVARITLAGEFLIGTPSQIGSGGDKFNVISQGRGSIIKTEGGSGYPCMLAWNDAASGDSQFLVFARNGAVTVGSINYNRAAGLTAYNTTSDYRAKKIHGPVDHDEVGKRIDALAIYKGQMIGSDQKRTMIIAHEATEAGFGFAVTGEKDAMLPAAEIVGEKAKKDTPLMQQVDYSAFVPDILAELQSLRARVATLDALINP